MEITVRVTGLDELSNAILGLCGLIISQNNKGVEMEKRSIPTSPTKEDLMKMVEEKLEEPEQVSKYMPNVEAKAETPAPAPAPAPKEEAKAEVPTSKPAYNFEQIQLAAANLARDGKRDELAELIEEFKIATLLDLTEDKFDAFALRLREIGGAI